MNIKFLIYIIMAPIILVSLDSLNINGIFKKNRVFQARLLYILIFLALLYLLTNFFYDFITVSKIF